MQRRMKAAWQTRCGSVASSVLRTPWCVRLFAGAGAEEEAELAAATATSAGGGTVNAAFGDLRTVVAEARIEFQAGRFRDSGLAGVFRQTTQQTACEKYLATVEMVDDLMYLIGEVLTQFHRISDGLGDYGTIRVAPWLHPFLEAVVNKVKQLTASLEGVSLAVDQALVLPRARGVSVKKPVPSQRMCERAQNCVERAVSNRTSHAQSLLVTLEELRSRASVERLPRVVEGLGDAYSQLQHVLASSEFSLRAGDAFRSLPPLRPITGVVEGIADLSAIEPGLKPSTMTQPQTEILVNDHRGVASPAEVMTCAPTIDNPFSPSVQQPCGHVDSEAFMAQTLAHGSQLHNEVGDIEMVVHRLTRTRLLGLHRHDRRSLSIRAGCLHIGRKGCDSTSAVKTVVKVAKDLEKCSLFPAGVLELAVRRGSSATAVPVQKEYLFECSSPAAAESFKAELDRLLRGS